MHYKTKRTAKEKSTSFYLSENLLKKLDFIASFENQSRSIIVEVCVQYLLHKGDKNGAVKFSKIKQRFYKKSKQKKKNFYLSKNNKQGYCKKTQLLQKSLFD